MSGLTGEVVAGRYELGEVIGRGGHSVVFRAYDRVTDRNVAVKMLHDSVAGDPEYTVRMVREQRATHALRGTAAVRVLGMCTSPHGALCLVMELLEGDDLDDYLPKLEARGERMGVDELVEVLSPIVDTLEAAHDAGIVHRDLKPGNIYLIDPRRGGGVRLLDFGLAKLKSAAPLTRSGMIIGSPSYIAPEVWAGEPALLDQRVDIYSLGAIVFRALAGRVPFEGATVREKLELVTTAPRPSLCALRPDLSQDVDNWVRQVLAVDPARRFWRIRAMWSALIDALGEQSRAPTAVSSAS
jgi:serine/threonine-protein kinase